MAIIYKDRVKETTTVTGTGAATLLGAVTGFNSFNGAGFTNGQQTHYVIEGPGKVEWEVGLGTLSGSPVSTLTRTSVLTSSNSNNPVNFSAGTKNVFVDTPAVVLALIQSAVQPSRQVTAGFGLSGGGDFSADRSLLTRPQNNQLAAGTNLNTIVTQGYYDGVTLTNAPDAGWWHIEVQTHSGTNVPGLSNIYTVQRAWALTSNFIECVRYCINGTWSAWAVCYNSGNPQPVSTPAPTTSQVQSAYAGSAYGDLGTYTWNLANSGSVAVGNTGTPSGRSGTWRNVGGSTINTTTAGLWFRIA